MTRYEAYTHKDWRQNGLAPVLVSRIRDGGLADFGFFLVDVWCLGVKDSFDEADLLESELLALVEEHVPEDMREPIHPTCAKKLIEGAVAYAEQLGFPPHRDFRKSRRILSGIDSALCPTEFTYGRDGRPCYVQGIDDSDVRIDRILARLDARVGPDGYDYELEEDEEAGADEELAKLRTDLIDFLGAEPVDVPRFYAFSGMLTALLVCPTSLPPSAIIGGLWPEPRPWGDPDQENEFLARVEEYRTYLDRLVFAAIAPDAEPAAQPIDIWPEEFPEDDPLPLAAVTMEWAGGFLRATELWPEAWGDALTRPDLAPHWEVFKWWTHFEVKENRDRIADAAEATPSRTMAGAVTALARALRRIPG